jgi:hypothetical protein
MQGVNLATPKRPGLAAHRIVVIRSSRKGANSGIGGFDRFCPPSDTMLRTRERSDGAPARPCCSSPPSSTAPSRRRSRPRGCPSARARSRSIARAGRGSRRSDCAKGEARGGGR